jgi:hypothetical protein
MSEKGVKRAELANACVKHDLGYTDRGGRCRNWCCFRDSTTLMFNQLSILCVRRYEMRYVCGASFLRILLVGSQKPAFRLIVVLAFLYSRLFRGMISTRCYVHIEEP